MPTIALYTDFGYDNWFAGVLKGVITSISPSLNVIDVTHSIESFDLIEAAFVIEWSYRFFPEGTVHVAIVDPGVGGSRRPVIVKSDRYFFIAPDNGILSRIFEAEDNYEAYYISNEKYFLPNISNTFHGRDIFAPVAAQIACGAKIDELGYKITDPVVLKNLNPAKIDENILEGEVVVVDKFGNLITNIRAKDLGNDYVIELPANRIRFFGLNRSYGEVFAGDPLVLEGSTGYIEVAVNQGNASRILSMGKGDKVRVYSKMY